MEREKRGVVEPGRTRDIEDKLDSEKRASNTNSDEDRVEALDDDFTKRAADKAANSLKKHGS